MEAIEKKSVDVTKLFGGKFTTAEEAGKGWSLSKNKNYIFLGRKLLETEIDGTMRKYVSYCFIDMKSMSIQELSLKLHKGEGWDDIETFSLVRPTDWVCDTTANPKQYKSNGEVKEGHPCKVTNANMVKLTDPQIQKLAIQIKNAKGLTLSAEESEMLQNEQVVIPA